MATVSHRWALSTLLQKTIAEPEGAMHGCLTLTAPGGDILNATYDGTGGLPNANGFLSASGTLTFTGGTGRFQKREWEREVYSYLLAHLPLSRTAG